MDIDKKIKDRLNLFKEIDKSTSTTSNKNIIKKPKERSKSSIKKNQNLSLSKEKEKNIVNYKKNNLNDKENLVSEKEIDSANQLNKIISKNSQGIYSTIDNMNILRNYIKGGNLKAKEAKEEKCIKSKEKIINLSKGKYQNKKKEKNFETENLSIQKKTNQNLNINNDKKKLPSPNLFSQESPNIRSNLDNKNLNKDLFDEKNSENQRKNFLNKKRYIDIKDFIQIRLNENEDEDENGNFSIEKNLNNSRSPYKNHNYVNYFEEISSKITPINKQSSNNGFFSNNQNTPNSLSISDNRIIKRSTSNNKEFENFSEKTMKTIHLPSNIRNDFNNCNNKERNNLRKNLRNNSIDDLNSSSRPLFYISPIRKRDYSNSNSIILDGDGMTNIIMNKNKNLNIINLDNLYQGSFNKDFCELYNNNNNNNSNNFIKINNNKPENKTNFQNYIKITNETFKTSNANNPINNYNNFSISKLEEQSSNIPIQGLNNRFNRKQDEQKKLIQNKGENFITVKTSKLPSDIRKMITGKSNKNYSSINNSNDPLLQSMGMGGSMMSKKASKIVNIEFEEEIKEKQKEKENQLQLNTYINDKEKFNKYNDKDNDNSKCNLNEGEKKELRRSDKLNYDYILIKDKLDKKRNEAFEKICKSANPQISKKAKNIIREGHLFHCRLYPYHKVIENQIINRTKSVSVNNSRKSYNNKSNDLNMKNLTYYNNQHNKSSFVMENLKRLEGIEDIKSYKIYRTNKSNKYLDPSAYKENYEKPFNMDLDFNSKTFYLNKSLFEKKYTSNFVEFPENKNKSNMPNLNTKSLKIAKSLEPSRLRLIKKKKKKILNDSNNYYKRMNGSKKYNISSTFNNDYNTLDNFNDVNHNLNNNNILSYDDYFNEKNTINKSSGFFNINNKNNFNNDNLNRYSSTGAIIGKRSRSKGRRNLDLYKRGIEKMKKKEALYTKKKLDEELSYKKFPFKPTINNNINLTNMMINATNKYKEENIENKNENISNINNINYGIYLSEKEKERNKEYSKDKDNENDQNFNKPIPSSGSFTKNINCKKNMVSFYDKNISWKQNIERKFNKMKEEKENDHKNIHTFKPEIIKVPLPTDEKFIEKNIDHIQEYVDKRRKIIQKNLSEISYKNSKYHYGESFKMKTTIPKEFILSYKKHQKSLLRSTSAFIINNKFTFQKENSDFIDPKDKSIKTKTPRKFIDTDGRNKNRNNLNNVRNNLKIKEFFDFIEPLHDKEKLDEKAYSSNSFFTRSKNLFNIKNNLLLNNNNNKLEKSFNEFSINSKGIIKLSNNRKKSYGYSSDGNAYNDEDNYKKIFNDNNVGFYQKNNLDNLDKFNDFLKNSYIDNSINIYNYPQNSEIVYGNQTKYIGNNSYINNNMNSKENICDLGDENIENKMGNFYDSVNLMHNRLNKD
jgi:hypothetical protein